MLTFLTLAVMFAGAVLTGYQVARLVFAADDD